MTLQSKRELIQAIRRVYRKASKRHHLDHLELVTELKRNYLNRLLLAGYKERRKRPGRQSRYARDPEFMTALKRIWVATRYLSGKLLKRSIRFYVETYQFHYGALPAEISEKLLKISPATIDRILLPTKRKLGKGKSMTSSDPHFRDMITIALAQWEQREPGHLYARQLICKLNQLLKTSAASYEKSYEQSINASSVFCNTNGDADH